MTKLDYKSNKPSAQDGEKNVTTNVHASSNDTGEQTRNEGGRRFLDALVSLGLEPLTTPHGHVHYNPIGIDWEFMLRAANAQAVLSILSIVCLMSSMLLTGFNFYRFTSSAWATYLLSCAYIGMRAGRWQSYPHAIAYCSMCTFQTLVYMSTMCWLFYSVYALNSHAQTYEIIRGNAADAALLFTLGEVLSVMGTVLTGVFGLIGCCRGFGRLLHSQEKMILDYQNVLASAYASGRRLQSI